MESLTHIALGAYIDGVLHGRMIGRASMLCGAAIQGLSDMDFLAGHWMDPPHELLAHRGFTHSFLFFLLSAPDTVHDPDWHPSLPGQYGGAPTQLPPSGLLPKNPPGLPQPASALCSRSRVAKCGKKAPPPNQRTPSLFQSEGILRSLPREKEDLACTKRTMTYCSR